MFLIVNFAMFKNMVDWGKRTFFSVKQKLNVFRKVILVLVTMTNYKTSMKNVQRYHVIRFLTKM